MKRLVAAGFSLIPLFPPTTPETERIEILQPYFQPAIGEKLRVDRREIIEKRDDPLTIEGAIKVTPPKGHCFLIRRGPNQPDVPVCQAKWVDFHVGQLDERGHITWTVIQGPNDAGTPVSWPTPYRMAYMMGLGDYKSQKNQLIPIASCTAEHTSVHRKITLELMNGKTWVILFPEEDHPLKAEAPRPNLYVRILTTTSDGKSLVVDPNAEGAGDANGQPAKSRHRILALKLSGRYKQAKKKIYNFQLAKRRTFEMDSSRLMENAVPKGMKGRCRYRYQGAPADPDSGVIECFNTDSYDALYVHLTCASALQANPKPGAKDD